MTINAIDKELDYINTGDKRLDKRAIKILRTLSNQPEAPLTKAFPTRPEVQACYRFFSNDLIDSSKIITPHIEKTIERAQNHKVVIIASDTTSLNYTSRKTLKDSGYISSNNAQGFFLHASIAVTPDRLHLGVAGSKFWAREKEKTEKLHRDLRPFEEKESARWRESYIDACKVAEKCPNSQIINVTDREGDIIELLSEAKSRLQTGPAAEIIIRSNHNRSLQVTKNELPILLHAKLKESDNLGYIDFEITDRDTGKKRKIRQSIQAQPVVIKTRGKISSEKKSLEINAILLTELNPPENEKRITWRLLTTLPIDSISTIKDVIKYYLCRWEIEVFFKTYKSGCKIEEKSLRSANRLYPLFNLFLIIAWRVNYLLHTARVYPDKPSDSFFEECEWKAGTIAATRNRIPPVEPPSMKTMVGYIGKLGGHLGRASDPEPGPKAIWKGLCRLKDYADAWDLFGPGR